MSMRESDVWARLRRGVQGAARGFPRIREYEDDSMEIEPDFSMRPDATAVRRAPKPSDYRSNVLPANYASPPEGRAFVRGGGFELNVGRSANMEDRRDALPRYRGVGPHPTGAHIDVLPDGSEEYMFPDSTGPAAPLRPQRQPPHPLAESVRSFALRERAARGNRRRP